MEPLPTICENDRRGPRARSWPFGCRTHLSPALKTQLSSVKKTVAWLLYCIACTTTIEPIWLFVGYGKFIWLYGILKCFKRQRYEDKFDKRWLVDDYMGYTTQCLGDDRNLWWDSSKKPTMILGIFQYFLDLLVPYQLIHPIISRYSCCLYTSIVVGQMGLPIVGDTYVPLHFSIHLRIVS